MRRHGTQGEVADSFVKGKDGPCEASNFFFEGNVLFSYGHHFPLCIKHQGYFIINGDYYSVTTRQHQGVIQSGVRDHKSFTLSLSALRQAFPSFLRWQDIKVIDVSNEIHGAWRDYPGYSENDIPMGATPWRRTHENEDGSRKSYIQSYHRPAIVLLKLQGLLYKRYILCGMDQNQYYVIWLPRACKNVHEAYEALKPQRIKEAEKQGVTVKRQGEWFCIPHQTGKEAKKTYKTMKRDFTLPHQDGGNHHICTRGYRKHGRNYFSGSIRHPQHRQLRVSKASCPEIWEAIENTAKGSWSAGGNVD